MQIARIEPAVNQRANAMISNWQALNKNGLYEPAETADTKKQDPTPASPAIPDYLR